MRWLGLIADSRHPSPCLSRVAQRRRHCCHQLDVSSPLLCLTIVFMSQLCALWTERVVVRATIFASFCVARLTVAPLEQQMSSKMRQREDHQIFLSRFETWGSIGRDGSFRWWIRSRACDDPLQISTATRQRAVRCRAKNKENRKAVERF